MGKRGNGIGSKAFKRFGTPAVLGAAAAAALAVPTAGLAVTAVGSQTAGGERPLGSIATFTPANVDPAIARRLAAKIAASGKSLRFTPAASPASDARTVTVAIRIDDDSARAISVHNAIASAKGEAGNGPSIASLASTRYNLGIARGYQSFAKPDPVKLDISDTPMADLSTFDSGDKKDDKPSRLQARISVERDGNVGRAPRTLGAAGQQSVDVGGAFRVSRNLDVTAGVRLSQDRDRLAPLTDSVQDNQAVYVGTQFRF
ncbi:MAG: hypothetical protein ACR2PC_08170 [Tsuneonella suprasediminis]|nr:hypothetical protein LBX01_02835 [Altererythrobacter sp. N1]